MPICPKNSLEFTSYFWTTLQTDRQIDRQTENRDQHTISLAKVVSYNHPHTTQCVFAVSFKNARAQPNARNPVGLRTTF